MDITPKLIKHIQETYTKYTDHPLSESEYIARELKRLQQIQRDVYLAEENIRKCKERCKKEIDKANQELRQVRSKCFHEDTTYHGDPSGGSDSFTTCNICGAEL